MNDIQVYLFGWLVLVAPVCFVYKWQGLRGWGNFWCSFWWPITFPFLLLVLPIYLLQLFVDKFLK